MSAQDASTAARLRLTRQREAVLTAVQQAEKHLTAQEVYDSVRAKLPGIAYGTVYNALDYLQEAGLIQAVNVDGGPTLYDRNTRRHDHLVCRQCGRVLDYVLPNLDYAIGNVATATGFSIERFQVQAVGLCPQCQR